MELIPILAAIGGDGEGMLHQLGYVLIIGICIAIIWWLGRYFIGKFGLPAIVMTVWDGLFLLLGGLCLINFLLSLMGKPFIKW